MHNALAQVHHTNMVNTEVSAVFFKCLDLNTALLVFNGLNTAGTIGCWDIMVGNGKCFRWNTYLTT